MDIPAEVDLLAQARDLLATPDAFGEWVLEMALIQPRRMFMWTKQDVHPFKEFLESQIEGVGVYVRDWDHELLFHRHGQDPYQGEIGRIPYTDWMIAMERIRLESGLLTRTGARRICQWLDEIQGGAS